MSQSATPPRLHCLDWIRVIAFGALIVYHIECFYSARWLVTSTHRVDAVDALILVTHPWRTALLFVVAGASFRIMRQRGPLVARQSVRLGAPLLLGLALLVPPQVIVAQAAGAGADWSAAHWLSIIARLDTGNLEHLWFIAYLLAYTLLCAALLPFMKGLPAALSRALGGLGLLLWPLALLTALRAIAFPLFGEARNPMSDWYVHGASLAAFVFGYVLTGAPAIWATLVERRTAFFACAVLGYAGVVAGGPAEALFYAMLQWGAIAAVLGYGAKLLNRESRAIGYLNRGVLPAFLVHQPIIVVLGFYLKPLSLPVALEATTLLAATVAGSWLAYTGARGFARLCRLAPDLTQPQRAAPYARPRPAPKETWIDPQRRRLSARR